ncbi:MAG: hypothetical protein C4290_12945, partial [Chloroflexota bacterium]
MRRFASVASFLVARSFTLGLSADSPGDNGMLAAVDLGGTNAKVLLARPDGVVLDSAVMPWVM